MNSDSDKKETKDNNINSILYQNNLKNITKEKNGSEWKIYIPSISLEAEIAEGTENETMEQYIGHFSETSKTNGNIGLAAHNRGYQVNYFSNLKSLKKGDEIVYQYGNFIEKYVVETNGIIQDTNWEFLQQTEKNTITLITCVENEPEYRRCVYGIKKE